MRTQVAINHGPRYFGAKIIELKLSGQDFDGIERFLTFRAQLAARSVCPSLRQYLELPSWTEPQPPAWIWVLGEASPSDSIGLHKLFDYCEFFDEPDHPYGSRMAFTDWLAHFHLSDWNDCLAAGGFFGIYQSTGEILAALSPTADPWIDAVLRPTRGILMWASQAVDLIRGIGMLTSSEADKLRLGWGAKHPDTLSTLQAITYPPNGQTLLDILNKRSQHGRYYQLTPNFALAAWLWANGVEAA